MATRTNRSTSWGIAGLLFNVAGLGWILKGNIPMGMSNIAIGMMFIVVGIRVRKRALAPDIKAKPQPEPKP